MPTNNKKTFNEEKKYTTLVEEEECTKIIMPTNNKKTFNEETLVEEEEEECTKKICWKKTLIILDMLLLSTIIFGMCITYFNYNGLQTREEFECMIIFDLYIILNLLSLWCIFTPCVFRIIGLIISFIIIGIKM